MQTSAAVGRLGREGSGLGQGSVLAQPAQPGCERSSTAPSLPLHRKAGKKKPKIKKFFAWISFPLQLCGVKIPTQGPIRVVWGSPQLGLHRDRNEGGKSLYRKGINV